MISQVNSTLLRSAYTTNDARVGEDKTKVAQQRDNNSAKVTKQGDLSKVDEIRNSIEAGQYKVNLEALANKIADQLI